MVFPLRDVLTPRTTPVVTWGLLLVMTWFHVMWFMFSPNSANHPLLLAQMIGTTVALFVFGENVEDQLGHARFPIFFLACGAAGALALIWLTSLRANPYAALVGGVGGVMGGYFVMFIHSRVLVRLPFTVIEVPAFFLLGFWLLLQAMGPSAAAALGGLLIGAALIRLFRRPERAGWAWREP